MTSSDDENQQRVEEDGKLQTKSKRLKEELRLLKEDEEERRREFHSKIDERLNGLIVPENVMMIIKREQNKLRNMDGTESEFNNAKTHLEWLTNIPWGKTTEDKTDINSMRQILDEDLFGLKIAKERILEFIECEEYKKGKFLCLCGPAAGGGKTSIAKSIARAMGKQYCDFSAACVDDVIFYGDKYMPGKLIQCLTEAQTENPGLMDDKLVVADDALELLIKSYCFESGVRNLEKSLKKIYQIQEKRLKGDKVEKLVVSSGQIKYFFVPRKFANQRLFEDENTPPGITMALATSIAHGGSIHYNGISLARKLDIGQIGSLEVIGDLSDKVKNSIKIAYTVAKNVLWRRDPNNYFLDHAQIQICISDSEGVAIETDGASGGASVVSAFLSLALDLPVRGIAMTGVITLHGNILPIGGIKEKIDAIKNVGIRQLILPEENREEFEALDDFVKEGITVHFVSHYDQIFPIIFPSFKPKSGIDKCDENKNVD